jgi:hypothetical protein
MQVSINQSIDNLSPIRVFDCVEDSSPMGYVRIENMFLINEKNWKTYFVISNLTIRFILNNPIRT